MSAPIPSTVSLPSLHNLRTRILTHLSLAVAAAAQRLHAVAAGETELNAPDLRASLALLKLAPKILSELPSDPDCDKAADYEPLPAPAVPKSTRPIDSVSDAPPSQAPPVSSSAHSTTTDSPRQPAQSQSRPPTPHAAAPAPAANPVSNTTPPPTPPLLTCKFCGDSHPLGPCHPGAAGSRRRFL